MDRLPRHPHFTRHDERWNDRREAWDIAKRSKQRLQKHNTSEMREQIIETAQERGLWSVWMTVFANDVDILHRLVEVFPGTYRACFDDQFRPIPRPEGTL